MPDRFRPRVGRYAPNLVLLCTAGWIVALAFLLTAGPLCPPESRTAARTLTGAGPPGLADRAAGAERVMRKAEEHLRAAKGRAGLAEDPEVGVDWSGLIGREWTPLVTTLGSLEAKRIAANPFWARVLTERLAGAGIGQGDLVAAGLSGSFPGLNLAVIAACDALGAEVVAVSSVTASMWGANQPGFTWPDMEASLIEARILPRATIAVTAGGEEDRALDLAPGDRALAEAARDAAARRLGVSALRPADFRDAVDQRLSLYRRTARGRPIALYVNVGGATASLGRSPAVLRLRSGFVAAGSFDRSDDRGVTARMAEQGVRVLMLLNIRDLALRWGVPLTGGER